MNNYYLKYILYKTHTPPLRTVSEVLWILISGWTLFIGYMITILPLITSIVGVVFVPKMVQIAVFAFDPIRMEIVRNTTPTKWYHNPNNFFVICANIVWLVLFGWEFFIAHMILAFVQLLTIVGAGNAIRHVQIGFHTLFPFGKHIRPAHLPIRPVKAGQLPQQNHHQTVIIPAHVA